MKQILYTCARCGKQAVVDPNKPELVWGPSRDEAPMEWATIQYTRHHTVQHEGQPTTCKTTCTSHVCGDCALEALYYIEPPTNVTDEHDDEGVQGSGDGDDAPGALLEQHAEQLMHINAKMFEDTVRVLGQQNTNLHEQVTVLMTENESLRKGLENLEGTNAQRRAALIKLLEDGQRLLEQLGSI